MPVPSPSCDRTSSERGRLTSVRRTARSALPVRSLSLLLTSIVRHDEHRSDAAGRRRLAAVVAIVLVVAVVVAHGGAAALQRADARRRANCFSSPSWSGGGAWVALTTTKKRGPGTATVVSLAAVIALIVSVINAEGYRTRSAIVRVVALVVAVALAKYALGTTVGALKQSDTEGTPVPAAVRGVLFMNLKSGGGKAERFNLVDECTKRGIRPVVLEPGQDWLQVVRTSPAAASTFSAWPAATAPRRWSAPWRSRWGCPWSWYQRARGTISHSISASTATTWSARSTVTERPSRGRWTWLTSTATCS